MGGHHRYGSVVDPTHGCPELCRPGFGAWQLMHGVEQVARGCCLPSTLRAAVYDASLQVRERGERPADGARVRDRWVCRHPARGPGGAQILRPRPREAGSQPRRSRLPDPRRGRCEVRIGGADYNGHSTIKIFPLQAHMQHLICGVVQLRHWQLTVLLPSAGSACCSAEVQVRRQRRTMLAAQGRGRRHCRGRPH